MDHVATEMWTFCKKSVRIRKGEVMATRNIKKKVEQPSIPSDPFELTMRSKLIELINVKQAHERKWGVERIIGLVDAEFRAKVWQQNERIYTAQQQRDEVRLLKAVDGMKKAYAALETWAVANGVSQVPEIKHCQYEMRDGSVMVVVETYEDALHFDQLMGHNDKRHIWCMEELELVMNAEVVKETMALKRLHPAAQMVRLDKPPSPFPKGGATGLEDMKSDDDAIFKGKRVDKVFDTSAYGSRSRQKAL